MRVLKVLASLLLFLAAPVFAQGVPGGPATAAVGTLAFGVTTTAAPAYVTGTTNPLSTDAAGNLRIVGTVAVVPTTPFSCFVEAATVTTQCQAAPAAGLRAYVTSVSVTDDVATAQTIDVVFGTGAACATGITALTNKFQFGLAVGNFAQSFQSPLVPTAANAICVRPSAATAFGATITGYLAP